MSVLIKGMEMPKNCAWCRFLQSTDPIPKRELFCGIDTTNNIHGYKPDKGCPLVPVPPHGRLIDADELTYHKWPVGESLYGRGWNDAIDTIFENAEIVIEEGDMSYNNIYERLMSASENNDYSKYLRDLLREAASSIGNMEEIIKSLAPTIFTPED